MADLDIFVDEAVGADVGAFGDARGASDDGGFVYTGSVFRGVVEEFDGVGEGEVGIVVRSAASGGRPGARLSMEVFSSMRTAVAWVVLRSGM